VNVPVTFFVGENGSGKSTLLEGIAVAAELPAMGASQLADDNSAATDPGVPKSAFAESRALPRAPQKRTPFLVIFAGFHSRSSTKTFAAIALARDRSVAPTQAFPKAKVVRSNRVGGARCVSWPL
jgi:ABC-type cobalamin/Fe3+-siderophores transport system ATPase subunit